MTLTSFYKNKYKNPAWPSFRDSADEKASCANRKFILFLQESGWQAEKRSYTLNSTPVGPLSQGMHTSAGFSLRRGAA